MNERIKELAVQAGIVKILEEHASEYGDGTFENTPYPELDKFVELIVRECLGIAHQEHKNALEFDWDNDDTAQTIRDSISEHFGVK